MTRAAAAWLAIGLVALASACTPMGEAGPVTTSAAPSVMAGDDEPTDPPPPAVATRPEPTAASSASPIPSARPPATARPRVLFERRVSPVPRSVADRSWEPVVATHPTDSDRMAVVYVHRGPGAACSINPIIRVSRDGGRTWRSTASSPGTRSRRGMGLHPAIAWGPGPKGHARLYWANMTSPGCGTGHFSLTTSYSDDEGRTWSRLRVERSTPPWVGGFPEIAVDRDPASPNHGTVYVGYNWLGRGATGPGFRLLASTDFGRRWKRVEIPPVKLVSGARGFWRIAYRIRTGPDGTVYATWYQVDLRRWDRTNIFAKGGAENVRRLGVAIARIRFDRRTGSFQVSRPRIAAGVPESPWTTSATSAPGTGGNIRPDPMWQYGFDVGRDGGLHIAVGTYRSTAGGRPRGAVKVGNSVDGGRTWAFTTLPTARDVEGRRQSSLRPNLVAGPDHLVVTMRLLDDVGRGATMGTAFAVSTDGGRTWGRPRAVNGTRWHATDLDGVVNGAGLRERAEVTAGGDVLWAYGDARLGARSGLGRTAVFATRVRIVT